jgi:phosphoribosylglycinamide formyltransferase-1
MLLPLAVIISGRGSNMLAIARACQSGAIPAHISVVIADRAGATGLAQAQELGLRTALVEFANHNSREQFESALADTIEHSGAQLVVLAGFMRVLSAAFVARLAGRLLNIHPALLPAHKGLHTHRRALAAGDAVHGATVHWVTAELDGGPLIACSRVAILEGDDEHSLSARVQAEEHILYPAVLGLIATGRVQWRDGATWLDGRPLTAPVTLEDVTLEKTSR